MEFRISVPGFLIVMLVAGVFILSGLMPTPVDSTDEEFPLFELLSPELTNITFNNSIVENEKINILTYEYFHNGGGVAIGDVNQDGLPDIYLTGNLVPNKLYLNQGNFSFRDITNEANVAGTQGWTTGVTMVDINQDGWLDIYVCMSGDLPEPYRANRLYVNNGSSGSVSFTEKAADYGIADTGFATQASFFDYDLDGDLDLYILNHNIKPISDFSPAEVRSTHDPHVGDKLYRNDGGKYVEVTAAAGIKTNPIGYGLGVSIGDINNDRWPDIYVANDFIEHDYLYINNGDGTFTENIKKSFPQISQFSMGTDMADFNDDGWLDIISVDMVAEDNYRQKTTMRPMSREVFYYAVADGFHYQYMHNALQLNRGGNHFSNISKLAGISNTDWSWAPLFIDLDLNGLKDLVVTNGYKRDISNKDYGLFEKQKMEEYKEGLITNQELFSELIEAAPVTKIGNYVFRNNGDYTFTKMNANWNFDQKAFSNGMAYGDLDLDGDLDLVINNIDDPTFIYRNQTRELSGHNYLRIALKGPTGNINGLGARIWVTTSEKEQVFEHYVTRGFQSSMDFSQIVGVGSQSNVDQLKIQWPDGKQQVLNDLPVNQLVTLDYQDAQTMTENGSGSQSSLFEDITGKLEIEHRHAENEFDDFAYEVLLPHKMSEFGPYLSVADINGDQLEDFFVGGSSGSPGSIFIQNLDGTFRLKESASLITHQASEDMGSAFFDADNDGDQDLYVVSGGNEFEQGDKNLIDRLYINDGAGNFSLAPQRIPNIAHSGSVVKPADFDQDGDLDLFIGGRMNPRNYPLPAASTLLRNDQGVFEDITADYAPELQKLGMVTDAVWSDVDLDNDLDLMVVGEWMPLTVLENENNKFATLQESGLEGTEGWWFSLVPGDFDQDGDIDFIAGNLGLNYKYRTSADEPFQVYLNDFDQSGSLDIVLGYFNDGELFPLRGRECSAEQMPFIKKKFPSYDLFGKASLQEIYGLESLDKSYHLKVNTFKTSYIENSGNGSFKVHELPVEAQFSAVNGVIVEDFNGDGHLDFVIAGNLYASEVETPRSDAGVGMYFKGNGQGEFTAVPAVESGLYLTGNVRSVASIKSSVAGQAILVAKNNDYLQVIGLMK